MAEYATRRSVKINQGRIETHTETTDDDSTIVGRIERDKQKEERRYDESKNDKIFNQQGASRST
eukprot:scaffold99955_cov35-Attheya_sp.AAC.1